MGLMDGIGLCDTTVKLNFNTAITVGTNTIDSIQIQLFDSQAPITVSNFLKYVNDNRYDNTIIHRSVSDLIILGGGFTPQVNGQNEVTALNMISNYGTIQDEFSSTCSNVRGTIAMAKMSDNPNSATSQWFINVADNSDFLDGGYAVFGEVIGDGMTFVDAINDLSTYDLSGYYGNNLTSIPLYNYANSASNFVTITSISVISEPSSFVLLILGFAGMIVCSWLRRK